jgi:protein-serine/threonine kinase
VRNVLLDVMLTRDPFALPSNPIDIKSLPSPLVKLTDFGLARFIDPTNPLLTTRCGSEYYSAPEIIMAQPYDGRRTDAWACGVVLFALATRVLPFDAEVSRLSYNALGGETCPKPKKDSKRSYMLRIAKGVEQEK